MNSKLLIWSRPSPHSGQLSRMTQGFVMDRESLQRLQERLVEERVRVLADPDARIAGGHLPRQLIRELAEIDSATRAVAAELARRRPRVGYGSEI